MKIIKRTLLILFLLVTSVTAAVALSIYFDCGACLQEQDYEFMRKVKSKLQNNGDTVKVTDIHAGEWIKVCASPGGYNDNLAWEPDPSGKGGKELIVLNDADPYITDAYSDSAIIFHYGKNDQGFEQIEIYQMTSDQMTYVHAASTKSGCLEKESAFMYKRKNRYFQLISEKEIQ